MDDAVDRVQLDPFSAPRRVTRPDGFKVASISVDLNGNAIRLLVKKGSAGQFIAEGKPPGGEYSGILTITGDSWSSETPLIELTAAFPQIELLPGNETLVVASRCRRYADGSHELNARVYNQDGKPLREFLLGDGISHVQSDAKGNIWAGYFDEGVFGNYGWTTTVGAAGLSCFTKSGEKIWDFEAPAGFDQIDDCYALNVARNGVWCYYYADFPVAKIDSDLRIRCWNTKVAGASTLAVAGKKVLFYGGYCEQRTECNLLALEDNDARLDATVSLVLPREIDFARDRVIGRDQQLHVFMDDDWYVFSFNSLR